MNAADIIGGAKPTLIILDDDASIGRILPTWLSERFDVLHFTDADLFAEHVFSGSCNPHSSIGLIDVDLGGDNIEEGIDVIEELIDGYLYFPVIFFSEGNRLSVKRRAAGIGSHDYIQKSELRDGEAGHARLGAALQRARATLEYWRSFSIPDVNERSRRALIMAGGLEHDIGRILAPINNRLVQLGSLHGDEKSQQLIGDISRGVTALQELWGSSLDVIRTGKAKRPKHGAIILEEVNEVLSRFDVSFSDRIHLLGELDATVVAERARLNQIVANLLDNARKYATPDTDVLFRVTATDKEVEIRVLSAGVSIVGARRSARLFIPGARESDQAATGDGMGLAIVRLISQMYGGAAFHEPTVLSSGDEGNAFVVRLPRWAG